MARIRRSRLLAVRLAYGLASAACYIGCILMADIEELSEEDQQLKSELDMLVERILVCCPLTYMSCAPAVALTYG